MQVQLGGVNVMGSPFQVAVLAARTNARASTAHGAGLRTCIAGTPASFSIVARDEFGNARSVCGDDFVVTFTGPKGRLARSRHRVGEWQWYIRRRVRGHLLWAFITSR